MSNNFRDLIPAADHPRIAGIAERDAYSHAAHALATRPGSRDCSRSGARGSTSRSAASPRTAMWCRISTRWPTKRHRPVPWWRRRAPC